MTGNVVGSPPRRGSVIGGSGILILARVLGMIGSFVLFLLITWRSSEATGIFRTAITYFVIMDTFPLLGMHRWLAAEISREHGREAQIFRLAASFASAVAVAAAGLYFAIASSGIYQAQTSDSLRIVALATVPSALNLCVMTALVGLGYSFLSGVLGLVENLARTVIALPLVMMHASVIWIVAVFALIRFAAAAVGLTVIRSRLPYGPRTWDRQLFRLFIGQVPNLAISMIGFTLIRSAGMLLLPWLRDESDAGLYAAPFQLFDLLLLVPTVLTISANFVIVESAKRSFSRLRRGTNELLTITAMFVCPFAAMACILARPGIAFLFGPSYAASIVPFRILMAAAAITALDQVLSSAMGNSGHYRLDRICIGCGAIVTVIGTVLLTKPYGATGAAVGLLAGIGCTLVLRLRLMGKMLNRASFASVLRRQALPTLSASAAAWVSLLAVEALNQHNRAVAILLPATLGVAVVLFCYGLGGLKSRRFQRLKTFMGQRG